MRSLSKSAGGMLQFGTSEAASGIAIAFATCALTGLQYVGSSRFTAKAASYAPSKATSIVDILNQQKYVSSKKFTSIIHPYNIAKVLFKHACVTGSMQVNKYMQALLEHEQKQLKAQEQAETGQEVMPVGEPPELPDMMPIVERSAMAAARELTVASVRCGYEQVLVAKTPSFEEALPYITDSRKYIREVLSEKHKSEPILTRLSAYASTTLYAHMMYFAAECTVAVGQHVFVTVRRTDVSPKTKCAMLAKGATVHCVRCLTTLCVVAGTAGVCGLISPSYGPLVGHIIAEIGCGIGFGIVYARVVFAA